MFTDIFSISRIQTKQEKEDCEGNGKNFLLGRSYTLLISNFVFFLKASLASVDSSQTLWSHDSFGVMKGGNFVHSFCNTGK